MSTMVYQAEACLTVLSCLMQGQGVGGTSDLPSCLPIFSCQ